MSGVVSEHAYALFIGDTEDILYNGGTTQAHLLLLTDSSDHLTHLTWHYHH